jgi:hypothetical protein
MLTIKKHEDSPKSQTIITTIILYGEITVRQAWAKGLI